MAGLLRKKTGDAGMRPERRDARAGARRKPAKGRGRRAPQGATRNPVGADKPQGRVSGQSSVWLNRLLILLGAGVVLTAAVKAFITVQSLPVQRISVTGELEHTQAQAVQDMVQPGLVGGFLNADLQQIRRQLEGLPWIYEATVRRKWPNALEIHVVEELPIARWGQDGFLNHEGGVFRSEKAGDWDALPRLLGPKGSAKTLVERYQRLVEILAPLNLAVEQLAVDERGQLEAVLAGGMQLSLGSDDFLERMRRFTGIYRTELAARQAEVARVDLRYESGVAVAFKEPVQADPSQVAGI
ncbi:MAG: cell division protein FtsQ/DivIB [Halioglobus sp.]|nr:cell division protein FtsQ/DivIB [Halioglobus sp.]